MADAVSGQFAYGDPGHGVYGELMSPQEHFNIDFMKDRILSATDSISFNSRDSQPFTIADLGTADGCVTIPFITHLIEVIRKKHGEVPIQVVYEDQPGNDFNSLFKRIHGLIPDPPTYLKRFDQVYVMASGTSFFRQVMPDNTTHFIMSFSAAHYLSELPTKFQNSLHRFPDATEEECRLVETQAAKDWETFLLHRAKELNLRAISGAAVLVGRAGGVLVVTTPCHDPEKKMEGVCHTVQGFEEGLLKVWRRFRDEGKITQEEFVNTNFQRCTRHPRELTAPFEDQGSAVYGAGLRLLQAETVLVPCVEQRMWQKKLDEEGVDSRPSWAKTVVTQHRPWSNNIFFQALANTRGQQEKEAVVKELFLCLEKEVLRQGPRKFKNGNLENLVCIRKV